MPKISPRDTVLAWWALHPDLTAADVVRHFAGELKLKAGTIRVWKSRYGLPASGAPALTLAPPAQPAPVPVLHIHTAQPAPEPDKPAPVVSFAAMLAAAPSPVVSFAAMLAAAPSPTRARGRASKLDVARAENVIRLISDGNTRDIAARASGISARTLHVWRSKGSKSSDPGDPYRIFYLALMQADAQAEATLVSQLDKHTKIKGSAGVKATIFILKSRYKWKEAQPEESSGVDGGTFLSQAPNFKTASDAQLAAMTGVDLDSPAMSGLPADGIDDPEDAQDDDHG